MDSKVKCNLKEFANVFPLTLDSPVQVIPTNMQIESRQGAPHEEHAGTDVLCHVAMT